MKISAMTDFKFGFKNAVKSVLTAGLMLAAAHSQAQSADHVLRVSAIPDEAPTELQRKFKPLGEYLEKKIGMKVEFTPLTDYAASVEALINKKVDMVWFGGFTFVQAKDRSKNQITPLVQRAEDEKFKSVFITTNKDINKLEDLKGRTLSFGSESSTSGHLMPRSYLLGAKINPDTDLKRIAFSGAHDATVAAVAGGKVDAGALVEFEDDVVKKNPVAFSAPGATAGEGKAPAVSAVEGRGGGISLLRRVTVTTFFPFAVREIAVAAIGSGVVIAAALPPFCFCCASVMGDADTFLLVPLPTSTNGFSDFLPPA